MWNPHIREWLGQQLEDQDSLFGSTPLTRGYETYRTVPGTGKWVIESPEFKRWIEEPQETLFCHGNIGTGKSVLAFIVKNTLTTEPILSKKNKTGIAIVHIREGITLEKVLRHALRQVLERSDVMPGKVVELYERCSSTQRRPSIDEYTDTFGQVAQEFFRTYIIIDALNELPPPERQELLPKLFELQNRSRVNLFMTSRSLPEIVQRFETFPILKTGGYGTYNDLCSYFDRLRLESGHGQHNGFGQKQGELNLMDENKESLLHDTGGKKTVDSTFGAPFSNDLMRLRSTAVISQYKQTMKRIKRNGSLALEALAFIVLAERPMSIAEIEDAFELNEGGNVQMVTFCEGFIVPGETDGFLYLVHSSVREYLNNTMEDWCPESKRNFATRCMDYLNREAFSEGLCHSNDALQSRLTKSPFYCYATRSWARYLSEIPQLHDYLNRSFLMDKDRVQAAEQAMQISLDHLGPIHRSPINDGQTIAIHLAAYFGVMEVVEHSLKVGCNPMSKDSKGRTPLWIATEEKHEEVMKALSDLDRVTFTLMLAHNKKDLALSLLQCAGQRIRDTRSRTALHIGALRNDIGIMDQAFRCNVDLNSKDGDGYTPLQLAIGEKTKAAIHWLLDHGAEISNIDTSIWLRVYSKDPSDVVELSKESSGAVRVNFLSTKELERLQSGPGGVLSPTKCKRLFLFNSCSSWPCADSDHPPLCSADPLMDYRRKHNELRHLYQYSVVIAVPVPSKNPECGSFGRGSHYRHMRIAWSIGMLPDSTWSAQEYFSTLPAGSFPNSGLEMFNTLVEATLKEWESTCDAIDSHLIDCRSTVLLSNGRDPGLIARLLQDANAWVRVRRFLRNQVKAIRTFHTNYAKYGYGDDATNTLSETTEYLSQTINQRIDDHDRSSSALIELEFNLTSIREAQKSTTLNRSIKRLSWITFIFLPLIFVSGAFGMNIDILASNPSWWWYFVFASATLGLTITVWVIFKRWHNLEGNIENWMSWLIGPSNGSSRDVEKGFGLFDGGGGNTVRDGKKMD